MKTKSKKAKKRPAPRDLEEIMQLAMEQAARKVREENKRWGLPLIVSENGKLVRIPPDKF